MLRRMKSLFFAVLIATFHQNGLISDAHSVCTKVTVIIDKGYYFPDHLDAIGYTPCGKNDPSPFPWYVQNYDGGPNTLDVESNKKFNLGFSTTVITLLNVTPTGPTLNVHCGGNAKDPKNPPYCKPE